MTRELHPDTKVLHTVKLKDKYGAHTLPVYRTAQFECPTPEQAAEVSRSLSYEGFKNKNNQAFGYSRMGNPTVQEFEQRMIELEGGEGAVAFASGVGAIASVLITFLKNGDHALYGNSLYSATTEIFQNILPKMGIETEMVDMTDTETIRKAIRPNTKLIYMETPANPAMTLTDLRAAAEIGKECGALTVADNTFASPYNTKPLEFGIDIVLESATKYISGHGDTLGGIVVSKDMDLIARLRGDGLIHLGACLSPDSAFMLSRGTKSFFVRLRQQCETAQKLAEFLESHANVERVYYPGLPSHPQYELAKKQMRTGGGMIAFEVRGGFEGGKKLMANLHLAAITSSLGDCETLIEHPASLTHGMFTPEERAAAGIAEGLLRLSVGLENADDLINDFKEALDQI